MLVSGLFSARPAAMLSINVAQGRVLWQSSTGLHQTKCVQIKCKMDFASLMKAELDAKKAKLQAVRTQAGKSWVRQSELRQVEASVRAVHCGLLLPPVVLFLDQCFR